jgi:uncharacterized protein YecE (DUF72 family)
MRVAAMGVSSVGSVLVGTAGFSYADWRGPFYPEGLAAQRMLEFYAGRFGAVELDYTYYRMPVAPAMASLAKRTGEGFEFCVKAFKGMTHERAADAPEMAQVFGEFGRALEPLAATGKLGCVLLQFPWSFKPAPESLSYLAACRDSLGDLPAVVEFRNGEWVAEERRGQVLGLLRELDLGFCCVDEPRLRGLMPGLAVATGDLGYVRFHGRNAQKWWHHEQASERYDYLYSEEELREWAGKIQRLAAETRKTYAFFNNCHAGKAATNASMMLGLLDLDPGR